MTKQAQHLYEFGPFRLDARERLLVRRGEAVELTAKVFDLLVLMVENRGRLLEKSYLLETLWPDSFVEEVNLSVNISALRKALGENASKPQYIETVPKRGYRFIADVVELVVADQPEIARTEQSAPEKSLTPASKADASTSIAQGEAFGARGNRRLWIAAAAVLLIITALASYWLLSARRPEAGAAPARSLAVLPFKTLGADEAERALGVGMADALITRLGNIRELTVRPTAAVLRYTDSSDDPLSAGRTLGVEAVLSGLVQRSDKTIRVSVQLLRVADGATLWTGKFDDYFTNIFAVQDSISEKMAEALSLRLSRGEQQLLTRRYTENAEAYQLYMQGRYLHFKYQFDKALEYLEAAVAKDPDYAPARAWLAFNYVAIAVASRDRKTWRDKAMAEAVKALSLAPDLDDAHSAMGWVRYLGDWDWPGAETSLKRAIELNPSNADARINYAMLLADLRRRDEALIEAERAIRLDPVSSDVNFQYILVLFLVRDYERAVDYSKKAIEIDPQHPMWGSLLPRLYLGKSMFEQAIAELEKWRSSNAVRTNAYAAYALAKLGRRAEAEKMVAQLAREPDGAAIKTMVALIYAGLGDKERAIEWLESAYQDRENMLIHLNSDPLWDDLRGDARFDSLLRRMGFPLSE